jgi:hypothetical protein
MYEDKSKVIPGFINKASRHEVLWGSGGIAPPFLTSALDGSGQLHALAGLPAK